MKVKKRIVKKKITVAKKVRVNLGNRGNLWQAFKLAKLRGALLTTKYVAQGYGLIEEARSLDKLIIELAVKIGSLGLPGEAAADTFKATILALDSSHEAKMALTSA